MQSQNKYPKYLNYLKKPENVYVPSYSNNCTIIYTTASVNESNLYIKVIFKDTILAVLIFNV